MANTPWWDTVEGNEAILKISEAGHKVFKRVNNVHSKQDFLGITYKDTTLKHPDYYYDAHLFSLGDLILFASLGKEEYLKAKQEERRVKQARVYTVVFENPANQPPESEDEILDCRAELKKWFLDSNIRAKEIVVTNPYTQECLVTYKVIYGYWLVNGSGKLCVCLRPNTEIPPKLPSNWIVTL